MIANSQKKIVGIGGVLVRESGSTGMKVNASKGQMLVASKGDTQVRANTIINDQRLKQVRNFKYPGSAISEECHNDHKKESLQQGQTSNGK